MPTRMLRTGSTTQSIITATQLLMVLVTSSTSGTPTLTITYTDQAGATGKTAAITFGNAPAVNSAFLINPYMGASPGARTITNMSISSGSAGVLHAKGLLVLKTDTNTNNAFNSNGVNMLSAPSPQWEAQAGDTLAFYRIGSVSASSLIAVFCALADN